jgi:hypothetical protein
MNINPYQSIKNIINTQQMPVGDKKEMRSLLSTSDGNSNLHRNVFEFLGQVQVISYNRYDKQYLILKFNSFIHQCLCSRLLAVLALASSSVS